MCKRRMEGWQIQRMFNPKNQQNIFCFSATRTNGTEQSARDEKRTNLFLVFILFNFGIAYLPFQYLLIRFLKSTGEK